MTCCLWNFIGIGSHRCAEAMTKYGGLTVPVQGSPFPAVAHRCLTLQPGMLSLIPKVKGNKGQTGLLSRAVKNIPLLCAGNSSSLHLYLSGWKEEGGKRVETMSELCCHSVRDVF
jgi:hypothetical protein